MTVNPTAKQISDVMQALGRRTSPKKSAASRLNGKKGGRPKKSTSARKPGKRGKS